MDQENKIKELNYSLTLLQRLLNPPEAFIFRIGSLIALFFMICFIIKGYRFWPTWILICIPIVLFRRYFLNFAMIILERDHSRYIVITPKDLGFGNKKPDFWVPRKFLKVYKGLAGTHLIRINPFLKDYLIVSKNVIAFSDLKKFIETNESKNQDIPENFSNSEISE